MGGGRTSKAEIQKARPSRIRHAESGGGGGGGGVTNSGETQQPYCARSHQVGFVLERGVTVAPDATVRLAIGDPLRVISGGRTVGELADPLNGALRRCLEMDYDLAGRVLSLGEVGRGELAIQGRRAG